VKIFPTSPQKKPSLMAWLLKRKGSVFFGWAGQRVRVYPSKDKMAWFGAVLSAMVGVPSKQTKQGLDLFYN
jgi:hypothetical protein